jgi:pimeloyl-ACP methyl ester carboxylesterase
MPSRIRIESLLSARLLLQPRLAGDTVFFLSDLSGRLSLYSMKKGGSIPRPLLPRHLALQHPHLIGGENFVVFPGLGKVLVMIDRDGDENYRPCLLPIEGGIPESIFDDEIEDFKVFCGYTDTEKNVAYLTAQSKKRAEYRSYKTNLEDLTLELLGTGVYGPWIAGRNEGHDKFLLIESYTGGDNVLYYREGDGDRRRLYGKPLKERSEGVEVPLNSIGQCHFIRGDTALIFYTSLFSDTYGVGLMSLDDPGNPTPVEIEGIVHLGQGEFDGFEHLSGKRFLLHYNIDGCSWVYEADLEEGTPKFRVIRTLVGEGELGNGVLEPIHHEKASDSFALAFSTATGPSQLYTLEGPKRIPHRLSDETILGVPGDWMSPGEDASYESHDGLRVSARLYLPSETLGFEPRYPVVFYIHGGPQSQERPDYTWFSMPLIQFFTMSGFAVFVPNVRGSSGYGFDYMKRVDHDWGGKDRLDHVHAIEILRRDDRLDMSRLGVMGRSYGGFMTLTLAGRHPKLWKAAVDMFGPYNLLTFVDRIPESWKPFFYLTIGHPEKDREFLTERSPSTYLHRLACPMLVVQGRNDPRVAEIESRDVVEQLRAKDKEIEYLVFENEGHGVEKFENKVTCYNRIAEFFKNNLT